MKKPALLSLTIAALLFFAPWASAQPNNVKTFGDYEVHYSIFNTSFLQPEIAKRNGIVRSKRKGMVNISILKKEKDGQLKAVTANVNGSMYDLIVTTPLKFEQVREQTAIYYLTTFDIENKIDVYFTFNVQPDPNKPAFTIELKKRLFWDE